MAIAEEFDNGDSHASIRAKLNNHANQINKLLPDDTNIVPKELLPGFWIVGSAVGGGDGSSLEQAVQINGVNEEQLAGLLGNYFRGLPGWQSDRILQGDLTWIDPPSGAELEKLGTPNLVFGTAGGDAIPVSWSAVTNGITYTLQRASSNSFSDAILIYTGSALSFNDIGLSPTTTYWYRLKVSAAGFASSDFDVDSKTTDIAGNTTPAPPALTANDTANTLSASHPLGASEIVVSENNGTFAAYTGTINVGNVNRPAGYWKFKIKAAAGRNESSVASSPAFNEATLPKPATPTSGVVDDIANTFNWTNTPGYGTTSSYQYTVNGGLSYSQVTAKPVVIGDVQLDAGMVGVRIKAIAGVSQASDTLFSTQGFNESQPDLSIPVTNFSTLDNVELVPGHNNWLKQVNGTDYCSMVANATINEGEEGFIQMEVTYGQPSPYLILASGTGTSNSNNGLVCVQLSINYATGANRVNGRYYNGTEQSYLNDAIVTSVSKIRLRCDGVNIHVEYFTTSWQALTNVIPQTGLLRAKGYFEVQRNAPPSTGAPNDGLVSPIMQNLKQLNFS